MTSPSRKRLHWLCSLPTPYNNFLFSAIAGSGTFDLRVHFQRLRLRSYPWRKPFKERFPWRCTGKPGWVDVHVLRLAFFEKDSHFIIGGWLDLWTISVLLARIVRGAPFSIWTDCPDPRRRSGLKDVLRSRWLAFLFSKADKLLVTGEPGVSLLHQMGCPSNKIVIFPYWVPIPSDADVSILSQRKPADPRPIRFFCAGRLEFRKRYDLAISAMALLSKGVLAGRAQLLIAGEGKERSCLEQMVKGADLQKGVTFLGWLEHREAMRALGQADVFIHPADWEPYGVSILEALARGKPIIASDKTMAAVDRVKSGVSGFFFKTGDVVGLAAAMEHFIAQPSLLSTLGQEARRTAKEWPVRRAIDILKGVVEID